jgi:regulator of replication initiation timing
MECLNNENFKNLIESVNFMSEKFDSFGKQIQELITSVKNMKEENQILREQNTKLKSDIVLLDKRMNILEQKVIENYVEIMGVPEANNENCVKIIETIAEAVGVKTTVIKAFRIKSKINNKSRKIIAELQSKQIKKEIMDNAKKSKLTGKLVNNNWNNDNIYINDSLTQYNRNLFFKTRVYARDFGYKFVWFKNLKLFIKKNENTNAIFIDNESSLFKLT